MGGEEKRALVVKNLPDNAGDKRDIGLIPGSGNPPEEGNPLQYSCLENSMDRGAWWAAVHRVTKRKEDLCLECGTVTQFTCSRLGRDLAGDSQGGGVLHPISPSDLGLHGKVSLMWAGE